MPSNEKESFAELSFFMGLKFTKQSSPFFAKPVYKSANLWYTYSE